MSMSNTIQQISRVRDVFDAWAQNGRADGMERGHGPIARQAFDALALEPGERYLDIGCGSGYSVRWAASVAPDVEALGIDVSAHMIAHARCSTKGLPNARFRRGRYPGVLLSARFFDAIFSMETLYYLPEPDVALRSVAALLSHRGRFACVLDYYRENPASHGWPVDMGLSMHLRSADEWRRAMIDAGLEVTRVERLHPPPELDDAPAWKRDQGSLFLLAKRAPRQPRVKSSADSDSR
jgi:cyclopropane fatty-acyl-phospholipid synthase-like methyltransferase